MPIFHLHLYWGHTRPVQGIRCIQQQLVNVKFMDQTFNKATGSNKEPDLRSVLKWILIFRIQYHNKDDHWIWYPTHSSWLIHVLGQASAPILIFCMTCSILRSSFNHIVFWFWFWFSPMFACLCIAFVKQWSQINMVADCSYTCTKMYIVIDYLQILQGLQAVHTATLINI